MPVLNTTEKEEQSIKSAKKQTNKQTNKNGKAHSNFEEAKKEDSFSECSNCILGQLILFEMEYRCASDAACSSCRQRSHSVLLVESLCSTKRGRKECKGKGLWSHEKIKLVCTTGQHLQLRSSGAHTVPLSGGGYSGAF